MPIISQWFPEFFDRYGALTVFDLLVDYCCRNGGGTLLTPYKAERISYGRHKIRQIRRT